LIILPDEKVAKLLVGHPVVVYVSDPFGFEYPDGGTRCEAAWST
jgi:hypothetical protein